MADDFKVGDTVSLKSGGPPMTIDYIGRQRGGDPYNSAQCSWFETNKGKQQRKQEWFALTSLRTVNPEAESGFYPSSSIMG
jgi:uncharacterized protein YodC (DUF2158 family)